MSAATRVVMAVSATTAAAILMVIETRRNHRPVTANSIQSKAVSTKARFGKLAPMPATAQHSRTDATRVSATAIAMMKDPTSRRSMIDRQKIRVATSRARLLRMLQPISPEKLNEVSEILATAEIDTNIAMLELHTANPAPPRNLVEAVLAAQTATRDANVGAVLDDTAYAQYKSYWESEPFSQTIGQISNVMRANGSTIPPDVEQQMLTAYAAAQLAAAQALSSSFSNGTASPSERASTGDQFVIDAMSKILTAEDLNAFMMAENKIDFGN